MSTSPARPGLPQPGLPLPRPYWQQMRAADLTGGDVARWIAVLPVAAIEQHGPHLPLGTDLIIAEGQVARIVERLPADLAVTFLPVQAIGCSLEHSDVPGTLTLDWDTAVKTWTAIGAGLARAGIRKLVIASSHGGNMSVADIVALELRARFGMLAVVTRFGRFGQPEGLFTRQEQSLGIHGGDIETSIMLHLAPDLVAMDRAADFASAQADHACRFTHLRAYGSHAYGWMARDLNPAGAVGAASAATAEKGAASLTHTADGFIALLRDVEAFDVTDFRPVPA
ncbi:creatininase family protein [Pseudoxanthobacter sp.]|uniref:creatininase family protein n=1 Tax=Pseudoxanthobacter sp. TaxID=1925742 RepID=UPI002FE0870C